MLSNTSSVFSICILHTATAVHIGTETNTPVPQVTFTLLLSQLWTIPHYLIYYVQDLNLFPLQSEEGSERSLEREIHPIYLWHFHIPVDRGGRHLCVLSTWTSFCLYFYSFIFSNLHKCHAWLAYDNQVLLDSGRLQHNTVLTSSLYLQTLHCSVHTYLWKGSSTRVKKARRSLLRHKRGKRGGFHARQKAYQSTLPSLLLANIQSLYNKFDEVRTRITTCEI